MLSFFASQDHVESSRVEEELLKISFTGEEMLPPSECKRSTRNISSKMDSAATASPKVLNAGRGTRIHTNRVTAAEGIYGIILGI